MLEKYLLYSRIFFVTLWVMLLFPFVSQEIVPALAKLHVLVFVLADVVFLVMGILTVRTRNDLFFLLSFVVIAVFSSMILNREGLMVTVNGMRSYFGLLFSVPVIRWFLSGENGKRFSDSFDRLLYYFLLIQFPCVFWQFIKYGAGDYVGGSLGNWSSGILSMLIYASSFYLISKRWDYENYGKSLARNYQYVILLLPTFFNETKASFIYFALYFVLLLPLTKDIVKKLIWIVPCIVVIMSALGVLYLKVTSQEADTVLSKEFFNDYLFADDEIVEIAITVQEYGVEADTWNGIVDIPRFSKVLLLPGVFRDNHKSMWTGAGLGQFKGSNVVGQTVFAKRNNWVLLGARPWIFFILVELGIIGLIWNVWQLISFYMPEGAHRNSINIKLYTGFLLLMVFAYSDAFSCLYFCLMMFYMIISTSFNFNSTETAESAS